MRRVAPRYRVRLRDPNGTEFDLTDRIDRGKLGSIQEAVEEEIASLEHSDISMEVFDADRAVEDFFNWALPLESGQVFELYVERETQLRRPKWQRVFGGVLDFPESLSYNRRDRTVSLQAFAWTKVLSNASAEPVRRTFSTMICNLAEDSDIGEFNTTTGLVGGDEVRITSEGDETTLTIETVTSGTQVTFTEPSSVTVVMGSVEVLTPYYRNTTLEFLVAELLEEAGFTDYDIRTGSTPLAPYPVATELNTSGLPVGPAPKGLTIDADKISASFGGTTAYWRVADSPTSGFVLGAADFDTQGDWRPYLTSEPTSIMEQAGYADRGPVLSQWSATATGPAWDHDGSRVFFLSFTTGNPPPPDPDGERTILRLTGTGGVNDIIDLGNDVGEVGYDRLAIEYDPETGDDCWISWRRSPGFTTGGAAEGTAIWNLTAGNSNGTPAGVSALAIGQFRCCRDLGAMFHASDTTITVFDLVTRVKIAEFPTIAGLRLWTLRYLDGQLLAMYVQGGHTRLAIWDAETFELLTTYQVSSTSANTPLLTVQHLPDGSNVGIGYASGRWFVLSKFFAGVIPYADFEGKSCGAALKDLCVASGAVLLIDEYKTATFRGRATVLDSLPATELPTPLEQESRPLWESYRGSIRVTGVDRDGNEILAIAGNSGDSAHALEVTSDIIGTDSLAQAAALSYETFFTVSRRQEIVAIPELERLLHPFDVVRFGEAAWLILEVETDLEDMEQDLTMVELPFPLGG